MDQMGSIIIKWDVNYESFGLYYLFQANLNMAGGKPEKNTKVTKTITPLLIIMDSYYLPVTIFLMI